MKVTNHFLELARPGLGCRAGESEAGVNWKLKRGVRIDRAETSDRRAGGAGTARDEMRLLRDS